MSTNRIIIIMLLPDMFDSRSGTTVNESICLHGDLAENFVLGIDHIPLALDFVRLGGKRLHVLVWGVFGRGERPPSQAKGGAI